MNPTATRSTTNPDISLNTNSELTISMCLQVQQLMTGCDTTVFMGFRSKIIHCQCLAICINCIHLRGNTVCLNVCTIWLERKVIISTLTSSKHLYPVVFIRGHAQVVERTTSPTPIHSTVCTLLQYKNNLIRLVDL